MHREGPASRSGSALLFSIRHDASIFCQSAESRPRRDRPESQREQRANRHIQRGLHQTFHPSQRNSRHARSVLVLFSFSPSRYVWDRIVSQASASNIFILAYSQGGIQAKNLLQSRESEVLRRLRAIALTESSHSLQSELNFGLGSGDSRPIRQFLEQHAINWVASSLPAGQRLQVLLFSLSDPQELEEVLGCLCISAGMGDTSNRALTNLLALECIFFFFQVSCPSAKHVSRAPDGLPRPAPSVAFWEHLVKSLGIPAVPSQPSEEPGALQEIPVTDLKPATDWIPDSDVSECQTCMKSFSFLVRKHHCRLCGRVVCGECSRYRMVLERTNKPVRVCRTCYFGHMNDGGTRMVTAAQVSTPLSKDDFQLLKVIGKGSFGKVLLVRSKRDHKVYALKILMKSRVLARKQVEHTRSERKILEEIDHPFLCRLEFAFQTEGKLYIGMEFLAGGPLFYHLQQVEEREKERVRRSVITSRRTVRGSTWRK